MRKKIVILLLLSSATLPAMADFRSVAKASYPMVGTLGGTPVVTFSVSLKDISNIAGPDKPAIGWTGLDPSNLGTNPWRISDQLMKLNTTITNETGGIQLVTDNTAIDASPQFQDPTPNVTSNQDSNPSGLLLVPKIGTKTSTTAQVAWTIKSTPQVQGTGLAPTDPNFGSNVGPDSKFQWLFLVDKKTPAIDYNANGHLGDPGDSFAFIDGQPYSTVIDIRGLHYAQSDVEFGGGAGTKTSYIYFEANFANALPMTVYKSNKLIVEAYIE